MKSSTKDRIEGAAKDAKGATKQEWGKATNDPNKRVEGMVDRAEGKFQKIGAKVKEQTGH